LFFISKNKQDNNPFTIYSDKNAMIIVEEPNVSRFLSDMIHKFQTEEQYEICTKITLMKKSWEKISKPVRKKRTKLSNKSENEQ
jgi:hypothetical protein